MVTNREKDKAFIGVCGLILISIAALAFNEPDATGAENQHYCEMVQIWESDAKAGIPQQDRNGWPNFKNIECNTGDLQ